MEWGRTASLNMKYPHNEMFGTMLWPDEYTSCYAQSIFYCLHLEIVDYPHLTLPPNTDMNAIKPDSVLRQIICI
jgi:hypothetical protein